MPIVMPVMVSVVRSFLRPRFLRSLMRSSPFRRRAVDRVAVNRSGADVVNGEPAHGLCYPSQHGNTLGFRRDRANGRLSIDSIDARGGVRLGSPRRAVTGLSQRLESPRGAHEPRGASRRAGSDQATPRHGATRDPHRTRRRREDATGAAHGPRSRRALLRWRGLRGVGGDRVECGRSLLRWQRHSGCRIARHHGRSRCSAITSPTSVFCSCSTTASTFSRGSRCSPARCCAGARIFRSSPPVASPSALPEKSSNSSSRWRCPIPTTIRRPRPGSRTPSRCSWSGRQREDAVHGRCEQRAGSTRTVPPA